MISSYIPRMIKSFLAVLKPMSQKYWMPLKCALLVGLLTWVVVVTVGAVAGTASSKFTFDGNEFSTI